MKNNVWKKFLAGLSAAAILVTSLGVMPIVSADESAPAGITETKLIEKITFDGYGESVSGEIPYNLADPATSARTYFFNSDGHRLDAKAVFKAQANISVPDTIVGNNMKFFYGGTVTTSLPERADGNRYFAGGTLTYKEVTFVDNGEGIIERQEAETTKTTPTSNVVYSLDSGADNNPFYTSNAKIEAGEQIVYEVAVRPSLTFSISPRVNGDYLTSADPRYFKNGLYKIFEVKNDNKLYIYDIKWNSETTKMESSTLAAITLPKTKDDWYDLKIVYTCTKDGSHEKVYAYVDGVCLYLGDMTSRVHAKTPSRADFNGQFDDFAITKYDGIKYDGINATTVVAKQDFNSLETSTKDVVKNTTASHWGGILTGTTKSETAGTHTAKISAKENDENDKYLSGYSFTTTVTNETQFYNNKLSSSGLVAGEQLEFDFSTRSDKTFMMYARTNGGAVETVKVYKADNPEGVDQTFKKWGNDCVYLWTIKNSKLYIHPGNLASYGEGNAIAYINLPANSWVDIKAVYTAYADHTSAMFYVNGKLALPIKMDNSDYASITGEISLPTAYAHAYKNAANEDAKTAAHPVMPFTNSNGTAANITRFNLTDPNITLDNFAVTKYDGIKYDVSAESDYYTYGLTPQEKEVLNTMTFDDTTVWGDLEATKEDNYYNGLIFMKVGAKVTMVQDGAGDQSAKLTTSSDTPWINPKGTNTGILNGEQFVVSADVHTATDLKFSPIIYQGYNSRVDSSRVKIETLFNIKNGKLTHSNGGGIANAWAGVGDYASNAFTYDLTPNSWVNLYLVYTKKAVGMDVDMYVDGELVKSASLPYNYLLNGPIQRIHTETGHIDNLCIKTYRFGAEFDPNSIPKKEPAIEVMPKITFDNFENYSGEVAKGADISDIGWSTGSPKFKVQANGAAAGTYKAELALKPDSQTDKYFSASYTVKEDGVKEYGRVINLNGGNLDKSALTAGQQLVFDFSTQSSKTLKMYARTNGPAVTQVINGSNKVIAQWGNECVYLYTVENGKLWLFPGDNSSSGTNIAMAYVNLPKNQWVDIKLVYTQYADKTTVFAYVNDEYVVPIKADGTGFVGDNGVLTLPTVEKTYTLNSGETRTEARAIMPFTGNIGRFTIGGTASTALDNFAVTKYDSIEYDASKEDGTIEPAVLDVRSKLTLDGDAYAALKGTKYVESRGKNEEGEVDNGKYNTWNNFIFKNGVGVDVIEDAEGDYSLDFDNIDPDKAHFKTSGNNTGLFVGEQMVWSMDIHTGSEATFVPLVHQEYDNSSASRYYLKNLFKIDSAGVLTHGNGGTAAGFNTPEGGANLRDAFSYVLPYDQWVNLNLVYTKKASGMKLDMYVNGELAVSKDLAYNYLLNGPFDRIEFTKAHLDNIEIKTYRHGAQFDASTLTPISPETNYQVVIPKMIMDDVAAGKTGGFTTNGAMTNNKGKVMAGAKGKATTDNYLVAEAPETQVTTSNTRMANTIGANGIKEGQQLVINFQVLPTAKTSSTLFIRENGNRVVSTEVGGNVINYQKFFGVVANEFAAKFEVANGESYNDDLDGVDVANLSSTQIPLNAWSNVTLVYKAGDAKITTAGKDAVAANVEAGTEAVPGVAEVVTATKNDTVTAYVNGKLVLPETELAENNLFRKFSRFDFGTNAGYDNIEILLYENGDFVYESAMTDEAWLETIPGFNGYSIFIQDTTLQDVNAAITAKPGVTAKFINASGAVVDDIENANAADVKYVSIKDATGKEYVLSVATVLNLSTNTFVYQNAQNKAGAWTYVTHEYPNYDAIPEVTSIFGKSDEDGAKYIAKDAKPEGAEYDYVDKRINFFAVYQNSTGGCDVFSATPTYVSFDFLSTGKIQSGALNVAGRFIGADGSPNGGTTVLNIRQTDVYGQTIAPGEWHNIAMQFIPGSETYAIYLDGVKVKDSTFTTKSTFNGIGNFYMDLSFDAYIDNLVIKSGIYTPAVPGVVELAVAKDANFGRGIVWDDNKVVTNKSANGLAYTADIAAAFSTPTEGATVVLLDANGAVATEGSAIAQIAVRGADGFIKYFKVTKRTGTSFIDEGNGNYIMDVADNSRLTSDVVTMFVVKYGAEDTIESVNVYNPTVDGDTLFFDGVEVPEGAKIMVFHNGTLAPLK